MNGFRNFILVGVSALALASAGAGVLISQADQPAAAEATSAGWVSGNAIYLDISSFTGWATDSPAYQVLFYVSASFTWSSALTPVEGKSYFYEAQIPTKGTSSASFYSGKACRMDPSNVQTEYSGTIPSWSMTNSATDTSKNVFVVDDWNGSSAQSDYSDSDRADLWGTEFLANTPCDAAGLTDNVSAVWSGRATQYSYMASTVKTLINGLTPNVDGTDAEKALARYEYIVAKYNLDDFIGVSSSPAQTTALNTSTSSFGLIALASLTVLGACAIGGYFLLGKKRKA